MPEEEYDDTTLRRLMSRIEGFFELHNEREKAEYERVRWLASIIVNVQPRKSKRTIAPKELMSFPWEENGAIARPKGRKLSPEEIQQKFLEVDLKKLKAWGKDAG